MRSLKEYVLVFGCFLVFVDMALGVDDVLNLTWVVHGDLDMTVMFGFELVAVFVSAVDVLSMASIVSMVSILTLFVGKGMLEDGLNEALFLQASVVEVVEFSLLGFKFVSFFVSSKCLIMSDAMLWFFGVIAHVSMMNLLWVLSVSVSELSTVESLMVLLNHRLLDNEMERLTVKEFFVIVWVFGSLGHLKSMMALFFSAARFLLVIIVVPMFERCLFDIDFEVGGLLEAETVLILSMVVIVKAGSFVIVFIIA